ncbi:MAG: CaiB/BaiF CoA-transferase family protein [Rhodospirillales bacterium]|jgi:crotonobetainyl-CoA:carnitine CoA-transferase CaiB-like acyl-CoA transferase|nr:CaiB/BaiF CoA-transferase family protein [Rhodospirillales bacterium]MDP6643383.1 CaiB/BaiF CoA-transferase family protein [Rhodospirillales bacterium]MDP6840631.1 CaiB/BaiF CoA-transferase family protein [Rhodospirillales bacterium]
MSNVLDGLLVVALEQAVAAPYCSSRLADAGARVIKIERAGGDFARGYDHAVKGQSSYFVWLNRGKQSIELDIKAPGDAALLARMIAKADIFIQNLAPGAAERAGFGAAELRARHPRLITCDISGYATDGPSKDMKAYDMLVQAETGLASVTGSPEAPGRVGVSVCDIAAGMYAFEAILLALLARAASGQGKSISCSLFDGMADWMAVPLLHHDYGDGAPGRVGLRHPSVAPYAAFDTKDGVKIVISIQNNREWASFAAAILKRPELAEDGPFKDNISRVANMAELERLISGAFSKYESGEMTDKLMTAGIAFGRVNSVADLSAHADLRRAAIETPAGEVLIPAPPARFADADEATLGPVPAAGAHSAEIRREFG